MAQQPIAEQRTRLETALEEFKQISDVLDVPTLGKPRLPKNRKWTLPCPDRKALADHPAGPEDEEVKKCLQQHSYLSKENEAGESYVKDSPKQTGRK